MTILPDAAALAASAADRFLALVRAAITARGVANVVLAGGSTPKAMNVLLAASPRRESIDWQAVRFFFGDERCVPPDHPDSNYRMTQETLFAPLAIAGTQIFRMHGEDEPHAAAAAYDALLVREFGNLPIFDAVFLGMGPDGHTASLFPGTLATIDDRQRVVANFVPKLEAFRLTLTPHVLAAARHITITVGGAEKAKALAHVLGDSLHPDRYPVQLMIAAGPRLTWLVDAPAAAALPAGSRVT
jgi:6-phosphogluconolactonase